MQQAVLKYGPMAKYVVAAGTCASFGGVSATGANSTACQSAKTILTGKTTNPVVNLSGCPVHPNSYNSNTSRFNFNWYTSIR